MLHLLPLAPKQRNIPLSAFIILRRSTIPGHMRDIKRTSWKTERSFLKASQSLVISREETAVSSGGCEVVAKLHDAGTRKVTRNEDKRRWRGRRERCILVDYRYRRYSPRYQLGCLECLLVSGRIWYTGYYRYSFSTGIRDSERTRKNKAAAAAAAAARRRAG